MPQARTSTTAPPGGRHRLGHVLDEEGGPGGGEDDGTHGRGLSVGSGTSHHRDLEVPPVRARIGRNLKLDMRESPDGQRLEHYIYQVSEIHEFGRFDVVVGSGRA